MSRLSLICPTIGRTSLGKVFDSVVPQLKRGDEFIIVGDGPLPDEATKLILQYVTGLPRLVRYVELPYRVGDFGCTPCDVGIKKASGDAVFFIGDDDTCVDGAFEIIRKAFDQQPNVPHLFAMYHTTRVLSNTLAGCNVSGQQIVIPRDMSRMPLMADVDPAQIAVSDWVFITKVHEAWDERTVFHDDLIAVLTGQNHGNFL